MSERRKRRRGFFDEFFGGSIFESMEDMFNRFEEGEGLGSGYSIRVTQTPEGTKVYAKVGKNMDASKLRSQLERQYPGAKIEIEGGRPLIREISTKTLENEEKLKKKKRGFCFKPK